MVPVTPIITGITCASTFHYYYHLIILPLRLSVAIMGLVQYKVLRDCHVLTAKNIRTVIITINHVLLSLQAAIFNLLAQE